MKFFKLKYPDGKIKIVKAKNALDCIKKYELYTREAAEIRVFELEGEQSAIAKSNEE